MTHIGVNAHLLSGKSGYRSAGIHGYIFHTLTNLPLEAPEDWCITAMVGANNRVSFEGVSMRRARVNTESPLQRILWEQLAQPFQVGDYDLVHAMAFVSPLTLNRPSVVTIYDLSFIHYPQVLSAARRLYLRWFTGVSCQRARRVIAISESTARDVAMTLGIVPERIDVAAPGYDASVFRRLPAETVAAFRRAQGLPERFWLFLGTLEPRKNLITLIQAYAELPRNERLPLVLAGGKGWNYEAIFAAVEQYQIGHDMRFSGYIPAADLPLWYNSAEAFVYPSVFEGFGLPVLEAMACGTPVLIADASSLPEVAGEAGLRVPPLDVNAWRDALRRVGADDVWRREASAAGERQASHFSWQRTARQTILSYQRALGFATARS